VSDARQVMHLASLQALILNAVVKICLPEVALQAAPELHDKQETVLILVVRDLRQWIVINLVCVHESLNLIFLKM
jgi:hypothetical protein